MKTNNLSILSSLLVAVGLTLTAASAGAAAPQTSCQENGHGAKGCSDAFANGGYCWESAASKTGYVCAEANPDEEVLPSDLEVTASHDPILVDPTEPGDDSGGIQALEIVICGPEGGAGCFIMSIPEVCCDQIGLAHAEPMSVGGATVTCYD